MVEVKHWYRLTRNSNNHLFVDVRHRDDKTPAMTQSTRTTVKWPKSHSEWKLKRAENSQCYVYTNWNLTNSDDFRTFRDQNPLAQPWLLSRKSGTFKKAWRPHAKQFTRGLQTHSRYPKQLFKYIYWANAIQHQLTHCRTKSTVFVKNKVKPMSTTFRKKHRVGLTT